MLLLNLFEKRLVKNRNDIFIKTNDNFVTYESAKNKIEKIREEIRNINIDIIGIDLIDRKEVILVILACYYEQMCFYIFEPEITKKKKKYIINQLQINNIISNGLIIKTLDNNFTDSINETFKEISQVIYTSGSTGMPKGVKLSYSNINNITSDINSFFNIDNEKGIISLSNVNFDMFISEIIMSIVKFKTLYTVSYNELKDTEKIVKIINENKIENILTTPSKLEVILLNNQMDIQNFKNILLGGENIETSIAKKIITNKVNLFNLYGPTETTLHCMRSKIIDYNQINIGTPVKASNIYILNEIGEYKKSGIGKAVISGLCVTNGYVGNNNENNKFININGERSFITSDIIEIKDSGEIIYIYRDESLIKKNGQRFSLTEINNAILDYKKIKFAKSIFYDNKIISLYASKEDVIYQELIKFLEDYLPQHMHPNMIYKIDEIKLTINGKFNFDEYIKSLVHNEQLKNYSYVIDNNIKIFISSFEKILKSKIDTKKSFLQNGGDSLKGMIIVMDLKQYGIDIKLKNLLKNTNLSEIYKNINAQNINAQNCSDIINDNLGQMFELTLMQKKFANLGEVVDTFITSEYIELSNNILIDDIKNFFLKLKLKYDGLSMYYDKNLKKLVYCKSNIISSKEYIVDTINKITLREIYKKEMLKCTSEKEKTIHLVKVSDTKYSGVLIFIHHFIIDELSLQIILKEFEIFLEKDSNNLELQSTSSYREYLSQLYTVENYNTIKHSTINIKNLNEYKFYTSVIYAFTKVSKFKKVNLFEIENNGRILNGNYYYDSIGWFTAPFNIFLEYNKKYSKSENYDIIMDKVQYYKEKAVILSQEKSITNKDNFLNLNPRFIVNFLGHINRSKFNELFDSFYFSEISVYFEIYIVGYIINDKLCIDIKYNINLYSDEEIKLIISKIDEYFYD